MPNINGEGPDLQSLSTTATLGKTEVAVIDR